MLYPVAANPNDSHPIPLEPGAFSASHSSNQGHEYEDLTSLSSMMRSMEEVGSSLMPIVNIVIDVAARVTRYFQGILIKMLYFVPGVVLLSWRATALIFSTQERGRESAPIIALDAGSVELVIPNRDQQLRIEYLRRVLSSADGYMRGSGISVTWNTDDLVNRLLERDNAALRDGGALSAIKYLVERTSHEIASGNNRQGVLYHLNQILTSCIANPVFCDAAIECATELSTHCGDRAETFFSHLRVQWELLCNPSMQREPEALAKLLIGIERMHLIEEWVRTYAEGDEEIEGYLFCLYYLGELLELPAPPTTLRYGFCGTVYPWDLPSIAFYAWSKTTSIAQRCGIVCQSPEWERLMWGRVNPDSQDGIVELTASLMAEDGAGGEMPTAVDLLRRASALLSLQDVIKIRNSAWEEPSNRPGIMAIRQRLTERPVQARQLHAVRAWQPEGMEGTFSDDELLKCRSLLEVLVLLGYPLDLTTLDQEINSQGVRCFSVLFQKIRKHWIQLETEQVLR